MGTTTLCVCHKCKEYVDLDKSMVLSWLSGGAIRFADEGWKDWKTWKYIYEIVHAHTALRFVFMHPRCLLDLVYSSDEDWDNYINVIKNYKEMTFAEPIEGKQWEHIWERPQESPNTRWMRSYSRSIWLVKAYEGSCTTNDCG